ncbi:MAG: hypothetical protein QOF08_454 [Gaiellales bacterium]|nr:hypothetical protein [Gaiellales bacterium]
MFSHRHHPPAHWLGGALRRHGDAVYEYAHFLTGDDAAARGLQRAAFLDAHQALLLAGRLRNPRAWLLRAVRDTAAGDPDPVEELVVLRSTCGLRPDDAAWVLGDDAPTSDAGRRRRMRVTAGAGAAAAMAARASTAKALAAQVPGFTAASATGATHLIVASAVAGSALVGTAAITTKLEQRPHHTPAPISSGHTSPNPRPANPSSDRSDAALHSRGIGNGAPLPGSNGATPRGRTAGQGTATGLGKGQGTGLGTGRGTGQGTGVATGKSTGKGTGVATGKSTGKGTGVATAKGTGKSTPKGGDGKPPTQGTPPTTTAPLKGKS